MAARFGRAGVSPGDVLFVLSASPREQALGFLGAMAAGALPTILSFPSVKQSEERFHETLRPIALSTGARWVASSRDFSATVERAGVEARPIALEADGSPPDGAALPPASADFLQFSSGTTGLRKCVRITGEMLADQAAVYGRALGLVEGDRVASWLPLYHDMGLVACLLVPLYHGMFSAHLSPFEWLKEPATLFRVVSTYRASLLWLPNFAYKLCADLVTDEALGGADLGSLRGVINCSEPVRARAHEAFFGRFERASLRPECLWACYAMAEATFAVTQTVPGAGAKVERLAAGPFLTERRATPAPEGAADSPGVLSFVSSGRPVEGVEVRIEGADGEEGRVGEILIRGPGVIRGYGVDGRTELGAFSEGGWYHTGDVGYLSGGELFVTGRSKDLIIHRGHNVYPADVEEAASEVAGIKPGRVVAFGVYDERAGTEDVIVALESEGEVAADDLTRRVREAVWRRLNVAVADVAVYDPGSLRKSTSGKLSRSANRERYLEGRGEGQRRSRPELPVPYTEPRDLRERQLAWVWEDALNVRPIGVHDNLFLDLGADSVTTMRAAGEIQRLLGRPVEPVSLLGADTIEQQAALLRDEGRGAGPLVSLARRGQGRPLFLVHAAGGWAFPYVTLARRLGEDRPIYAFQTPALQTGEGGSLTIGGMAEEYLKALRAVQPTGPYLLGGWSLGGLVAFEMATRLERAGDQVAHLTLFDTAPPRRRAERAKSNALRLALRGALGLAFRAPGLASRLPPLRPLGRLTPVWRFFVAYLVTGEERNIAPLVDFAFGDRCDRGRLASLGVDESWDYVVHLAREHAAPEDRLLLIPGLDGAAVRRALRVSRRLEELNGSYAPEPGYRGRLDVVGVEGNAQLQRWREQALGRVDLHWFPLRKQFINAHFDMMEPANVELFAPALRRLLAAADA